MNEPDFILQIPVAAETKRERQRLAKKAGLSLYAYCAVVLQTRATEPVEETP